MPKSYLLAIKSTIAGALLVVLVAWVHFDLGWQKVLDNWTNVSLPILLLICIAILISHGLRVVRVYLAYRKKFDVKLFDVAGVSLVHNTVSFLLPMRLGEAALPLLSKNQLQVDLKYSISALVLLRVFDAHVLLMLILCFGSNAYLEDQAKTVSWVLALSTPIVAVGIIKWLRKQIKFAPIAPLVSSFRSLIILYLNTGLVWLVKIGALALLAQQLGITNVSHAWIATIIADASALSPITGFANAGTFEAAFVLPLIPLGYGKEELLSIALNVHILILLTNIVAGAFGAMLLMFKKSFRQE